MSAPRVNATAVLSIGAAWVLSIGIDLFLHAGLFARLYVEPSPFLLPAEEAFRRIPLGYLTFLLLTAGLFWLAQRLQVRGLAPGFRLGAVAGGIVWGALVLGLYSFSTASMDLLAAWWIGQTAELAFAGAVLGAAANGVRMRRIWGVVTGAVVVLAAVTVALQSLGLAPAMKVVDGSLAGQPSSRVVEHAERTPGKEPRMTEEGHNHHEIDYIEFSVTDMAGSKRFFSAAFDWEFTDYGPEYAGIRKRQGGEAGGLRVQEDVAAGGPLVILYSDDLERTLARVRDAGGEITREIFEFPGGRRFQFRDPSGNELAVWSAR